MKLHNITMALLISCISVALNGAGEIFIQNKTGKPINFEAFYQGIDGGRTRSGSIGNQQISPSLITKNSPILLSKLTVKEDNKNPIDLTDFIDLGIKALRYPSYAAANGFILISNQKTDFYFQIDKALEQKMTNADIITTMLATQTIHTPEFLDRLMVSPYPYGQDYAKKLQTISNVIYIGKSSIDLKRSLIHQISEEVVQKIKSLTIKEAIEKIKNEIDRKMEYIELLKYQGKIK